MSQETVCFSATLYVDGERAGTIQNDGWGGGNMYHPVKAGDHKLIDAAHDRAKFIESEFGDLDICIDALLRDEATRKWLKRNSKTKTLFTLPETPEGEYRVIKAPYSEKVRAFIMKKYPTATVINPAEL